ncbi:hypothetical protein, partial [Leptospira interrogans]|uniref:hypothetical protein n=1 Tax=Leptospira interrogans TaxID=173 RepID=UPI000A62C2F2
MDRRSGAGTKFYRGFCRNSNDRILRSNYLWVRLCDLTSCSGEAMLPSSFRQNVWDFQFL